MARGRVPKLAGAPLLLIGAWFMISSCAQAHTHHRVHTVADGPGLRSASALVIDETHSSVLYSRNAGVAAPIASITKLLTALVIADAKLPLDERIQITQEDRHLHKGSFSRLAIGTTLSRGDLIHLALMASENRAAHALGRSEERRVGKECRSRWSPYH